MKYRLEENILRIDPENSLNGKTAADFLDLYKQSKKNRYLLLQEKRLLLDGIPVKDTAEKIAGKEICIVLNEEEPDWIKADTPCRVIYNAPLLYIAHKEPGVIIHGGPDDNTCLMAQAARWQADNNVRAPVRPIHRLDRDTTGLVFFSKVPFFQPWFDDQLKEKKIRRRYLAVCYGSLEPGASFECTEPLGKDRHRNNVYRVSPDGVSAHTKVTCAARRGPYVLLDCELLTGRTHQIRVHLSHRGFPIVNDPIYGKPSDDFRRMGLWADRIEYRDPITHKKHRIHDEPVDDYAYFQTGE